MSKISDTYCLSPTIIRNKSIWQYVGYCYYSDGLQLRKLTYFPRPSQLKVNVDNIDNYRLVTPDGECIPLFLKVPCGKCLLCGNKKKASWALRAKLETATSIYKPIFVTLTYQDKFLPQFGLDKKEIQNFLKRFRINYKRMYDVDIHLRYMCCGEYGMDDSYTHRPHYHMLFWNVPFDTDIDKLHTYNVIAKSWSDEVDKKHYQSIPYDFLKLKLDDRYFELFGRIDVQEDKGYTDQYVCKYMLKGANMPTDDPCILSKLGTPFFLSSRGKGGIGSLYIKNNIDEYRSKLLTSIRLKDKDYIMPISFKNILYPSISKLLHESFIPTLCRLYYYTEYLNNHLDTYIQYVHFDDFDSVQKRRTKLIDKCLSLFKEVDYLVPYLKENMHTYTLPQKLPSDLSGHIFLDYSFYLELKITYLIAKYSILPYLEKVNLKYYIDLKNLYKDEICRKYSMNNKIYYLDEEEYKIKKHLDVQKQRWSLHRISPQK